MSKKKKAVWGVVIMVVALTLFVPGVSVAGSLEPSTAPASTMKTLDQIPPTWSQILPDAQRFQLVLGDAAVLDKETGLVWEKSPGTRNMTWQGAMSQCQNKTMGNRKGWRMPTVEELASLVDPSVSSPGPTLPNGHPFIYNVQSITYWSATTTVGDTTYAWAVVFSNGGVFGFDKTDNGYVWCVRGGQAYDGL